MSRTAAARAFEVMTDAELDRTIADIVEGAEKPAGRATRTAGLPRCPEHLTGAAAREWRRVAGVLHAMGVLTTIDRAALAAYCQAYGRWVEAERRLEETPMLLKTPSGYVQQSPWLGIVNKQLELMGRFMVELGMTPASRSRVSVVEPPARRSRPEVLADAEEFTRRMARLVERTALQTDDGARN